MFTFSSGQRPCTGGTGNGWTRGHIAPHQAQNIRNHSALSKLFLHSQLISRMGETVAQDSLEHAGMLGGGRWSEKMVS